MEEHSVAAHAEVEGAIRLWEGWIETQVAYADQPGLSVGVVYDQDLIWSRGFGFGDLERHVPATPQTIYRVASITKLFTSTAIMQLRDQDKLQLDDPLAKYLSWFSVRTADNDAPPITIRHLLTHTSGLPREAHFPYWTDNVFPSREQLMNTLGEQEAIYAPATRWKYSNLALTLAGEIVQAVADRPYADYIQQQILDPLRMTATSVMLPDAHRAQLATGYTRRIPGEVRQAGPFTDCAAISPAANMSSTVEDLARFAALQFQNGAAGGPQILAGSSLREMQRIQWLNGDWKSGWGLGFSIERAHERTLIGHGGALPGYRTKLSICVAQKIAVIVLTNADDGNPDKYVDQAWSTVAPAITRATTPPPADAPTNDLARYVGLYRSLWGDTRAVIQHTGLVLFNPNEPDPQATMLRLTPTGEHSFRAEGDNGYAAIGEGVVFEMGPEGEVVRLKVGENYSYPINA
jgi:CubicO group peptidase (beta-lactamase class C family)